MDISLGTITNITDCEITHTKGKYFYELKGCVLGKARFNASKDELEARMVPLITLPNKESFYFGDSIRTVISRIMKSGGKVYGELKR